MRYRLAVLAAAFLFSTGGAVIKLTTLTSWEIAGLRSLAAAAVLFILLPESRRITAPRTWLAAIAYAATLVLFVLATKLTTSANAIFLQATAPLWLLMLGPPLLGERNRPRDIALGAALAAGMACSFLDPSAATSLAPRPALGNMLAAASGLTWAVTVIALRAASRREGGSSLPVVTAGNLLAFALSLPFLLPLEPVGRHDLLAILYLGIFQVGMAYVFLNWGMRHVPAFESAALVLVEPAINPIWTLLLLGERPGPLTIVGGLLIVSSTLAHAVVRPRTAAAAADAAAMTPD
jgi:drug/metabolite transporter (DMT)-like permease